MTVIINFAAILRLDDFNIAATNRQGIIKPVLWVKGEQFHSSTYTQLYPHPPTSKHTSRPGSQLKTYKVA